MKYFIAEVLVCVVAMWGSYELGKRTEARRFHEEAVMHADYCEKQWCPSAAEAFAECQTAMQILERRLEASTGR